MKPVGIFRAARTEEPGYFATYLERRSIEWQLVALDEGAPVPKDPRRFSGVVFMGGAMSVNDDLPWITPVLELIRDCVRRDVPVLGHCLGGQLLSKAFGGVVGPNAVKELGWGQVRVCDNEVARSWLGDLPAFESFHWHGETFTIPPGATRVMESAHCANQAFALGKHFGMQCHIEMTEALVKTWLDTGTDEMRAWAASPAVQSRAEIERALPDRVKALNGVATRIYDRWTEGLGR
jgi:GMP synthase-like glutamine amidotransferase